MNIDYSIVFSRITDLLTSVNPAATNDITHCIKDFFHHEYKNHEVHSSYGSSEYLLDILVSNFKPLEVLSKDKKLTLSVKPIEIYIAVESELGGEGASSAYGVHKNAVYDFIKLLSVQAKYKIMLFTSLPYANECNHVINRVESLRDVYSNSYMNPEGVLLIHLPGSQPNSAQVQANVTGMTGYTISGDGATAMAI